MMKRIIKINTNIQSAAISNETKEKSYTVTKYFDEGDSESDSYSIIKVITIQNGNELLSDSIVEKIEIQPGVSVKQDARIIFNNCIFLNEIDIDFGKYDGGITFRNCIFNSNITLSGVFDGYVSFEQSSFINAAIDFYECLFAGFNFRLVTLSNSNAGFQETEFRDENPEFSNIHLYSSKLRFMGTIFPTSAKLLNLLGMEADSKSEIKFRMIDFDFREIRLFHAKINTLEFSDCTFNCNRFEWDCECETLILQNCRNFRMINLAKLTGLKNFNIHGMLNTGKIVIGDDISYYLFALKTSEEVFWVRADEYRSVSLNEYKNQLFILVDLFALSQVRQIQIVQHEIEVIEREEQMMSDQGIKTKIFLSYAWKDEALADSIDSMFENAGITLIRDKRGLEYRDSIKEFMKQIRFNDYVILIISPDYIKSANCMYEIAELVKDENYKSRILPVIKKDTNIFDPIGRNSYILYWQDIYKQLYDDSDKLEPLNRSAVISDLLRYERIMRDLPVFLQSISDMNMILCDDVIDEDELKKMLVIVENASF